MDFEEEFDADEYDLDEDEFWEEENEFLHENDEFMDENDEFMDAEDDLRTFLQDFVPQLPLRSDLNAIFGHWIAEQAFNEGLDTLRPMISNKTAPALRWCIPTTWIKLTVKKVLEELEEVIDQIRKSEDHELIDELLQYLEEQARSLAPFYFMKRIVVNRKKRVPRFQSVDSALAFYESNPKIFASVFGGWYPPDVADLAMVFSETIPNMHGSYTWEERVMCVLARFKMGVSDWEMLGFMFGRNSSRLCQIFTTTVSAILDTHGWLLDVESIDRVTGEYLSAAEEAISLKWQQLYRGPSPGSLPERFRGVNALILPCVGLLMKLMRTYNELFTLGTRRLTQ